MSNRKETDVELPEDELNIEEEVHDLKNAEAQSVSSVEKAARSVKRSPEPKTKGAPPKGDAVKKVAAEDIEIDFSEDLNALVESEATLSDEFKAKTAIIFETAIRTKLTEEIERLEEEFQARLEEELQATRQDLIEKVDSYLNYVVESWMKQNELAIDTGLRTEISEDFMNKLKNLFVESYIEVPESKIDLVDELADQVETLESKLDEQTQQVMEMTRMLEQHQRDAIVRDASRDLAETQVSKLITLVESLDFESAETFAKKVKTVKESYFKKAVKQEEQITEEEWETAPQVTGLMEQYLSAIKKTSK
jgi:hypothetical protein